jgi:hypothetical protein
MAPVDRHPSREFREVNDQRKSLPARTFRSPARSLEWIQLGKRRDQTGAETNGRPQPGSGRTTSRQLLHERVRGIVLEAGPRAVRCNWPGMSGNAVGLPVVALVSWRRRGDRAGQPYRRPCKHDDSTRATSITMRVRVVASAPGSLRTSSGLLGQITRHSKEQDRLSLKRRLVG